MSGQNQNSGLIKKYNIPGPRYTSYPTVPYWEKTPSEVEWIQSLRTAIDHSPGTALYVHIPFCQSLCTYCGCNTRITRNESVGHPYVETVLKEWGTYLSRLEKDQFPVSEIHLGGGTPTFLKAADLDRLVGGLLRRVRPVEGAEFSIEVDPRVTTEDQLRVLAEHGFSRISLGVQDFDLKVQEAVNRVQSFKMVQEMGTQARDLGYTSINFDLIYGLPFQTVESIRETIRQVVELRPDRIAFYSYAHVPWIKPGHRRWKDEDLPSGEEKRLIYEAGRKILEDAGYQEIGMDHFALESDSLWKALQSRTLHRNFMGYISRHASPLIGLGVSAISDSWSAFSQNEKVLENYVRRVEAGEIPILRGHVLTTEDQILRKHILNLMTQFETEWHQNESNTPYLDEVPSKLRELATDQLVELTSSGCQITPKGRTFLRNACMAFDARLARKAPQTKLFSQTI